MTRRLSSVMVVSIPEILIALPPCALRWLRV